MENNEDINFQVDPKSIESKTGNYLVTVGNVGSGKSTLQSHLVFNLWSNEKIGVNWCNVDGNPNHDAVLNQKVTDYKNGHLPIRTKAGILQEFNLKISQAKRPTLKLSFLEIAGEDIKSILPSKKNTQENPPKLNEDLEQYLKLPSINKRFIFVSDTSKNRLGARNNSTEDRLGEDILFHTLISYLLNRKSGLGLNRVNILFVAAKWDIVKNEYKSERTYFEEHFPNTRELVNRSDRITASFMPFMVGDVTVSEKNGETISMIKRLEKSYGDVLTSWVYHSFTQRTLIGLPKIKRNLWDKIKDLAAG